MCHKSTTVINTLQLNQRYSLHQLQSRILSLRPSECVPGCLQIQPNKFPGDFYTDQASLVLQSHVQF